MNKTWFVYLIECADGSLYTGIAVDVASRFKAHREGRGARYMRLHPPLRILATQAHADRSSAAKAEYRIKQLTPDKKRACAAAMAASVGVQPSAPAALSGGR